MTAPTGPVPDYPSLSRCETYCCTMAAIIIIVLLVIVLPFCLIEDLILSQRVPTFTITSLSLSSLDFSSSSPSLISAVLIANWTVTNPNHNIHLHYVQIMARVFYNSSLPLAVNQLPPFVQTTKSQTNGTVKLVAMSTYIAPELIPRLKNDVSNGSVKFDVQVLALVRCKAGIWRDQKEELTAFCNDLPLDVAVRMNGSYGRLSGGEQRCTVHWWWPRHPGCDYRGGCMG